VVKGDVLIGVNGNVVHVDFKPAFCDHVRKNVIHERLKCRRGITKSKEHDSGFKETEWCDEGRFPLVFFMNANIVDIPSEC
jgi:hypothetical protein